MSPHTCPRSFEAEALRDGRLTGAERARFEAHVQKCVDCTRASRELDELSDRLRAMAPAGADDLHVRRERTRLLAAFNRRLVEPQPRSAFRWLALVPIAALVLVAILLVRARRPSATRADDAVVLAEAGAAWSEHVEGSSEIVELDQGTLSIHVEHGPGAKRLVVRVPDGEIEDTGTIFRVSVTDGRTSRVSVQEGSVILHMRGSADIAIAAGGTWSATAPISPSSAPASATSAANDDADASPTRPPKAIAATPSGAPSASIARASGADAAGEFRDATSALDRGDGCEAAGRFTRFVTAHPNDSRTEDAAYLRVLALQRCGDAAATKDAARDYLARFPTGFRHAELEALAR